ncbi:gamma-glutamyl-gamma-aminobutyrate hydrolase family protein [Herbiconiux sp. CPCC 205763]|uniref:Gamma-glutamyl-gamma-aminobutyrate hydrolase family protein n=1 Tax=Herbiconiux aconitum TaxID=2970913 RepID=A0ABT2GSS2_9MICO|nr:gamma-glutamyl-gamma-aminobutyrate hydrolase family protein [Herbiconiux aconitum]MCS5719274.1 gamma-glutamyl-gamma-aminobutyrate hydrolase family protein [Herbiconiux aconitum]
MNSAARLSVVVVTRERLHAPDYHAYSSILIERAVAAAVQSGWQVDVVAAQDEGRDETLRRTDDSAALLILGGEDVAPEFYGAARGYRGEGAHAERADEAQIALVQRAVQRGTPLLGVCRGHQIIDVALGGTLIQDLGEGSSHRHDDVPIERVMSTHEVHIAAGSRLLDGLGPVAQTRSAHHQAVDRLGAGLAVVARASDGLIEAIEHTSAPVLGVQWHPEDPGAPRGQLAALLGTLAVPASLAA